MSELLKKLRMELQKVADPKKAPQMQAYMKSVMPYHGVPSPIAKEVYRKVFSRITFSGFGDWERKVLGLWRKARFREERYAAIRLASHSSAKHFQSPQAMPLYEELIVTGAWWDYVDDLAGHHVGKIVASYPKEMKPMMLEWSKSENLWKRRTAILCQLGFKEKTDLAFLYQCMKPSLSSEEFFLRKAIGWALRQVAWRNPAEVIRYVRENQDRLSALSKREALKNLLKSGKAKKIP